MELKVLNKEKTVLEVVVYGMEEGLANMIAKEALDAKSGFAAVSLDHPLTGSPVLHIQASSPKEALVDAAKAAEQELASAEEALDKTRGK